MKARIQADSIPRVGIELEAESLELAQFVAHLIGTPVPDGLALPPPSNGPALSAGEPPVSRGSGDPEEPESAAVAPAVGGSTPPGPKRQPAKKGTTSTKYSEADNARLSDKLERLRRDNPFWSGAQLARVLGVPMSKYVRLKAQLPVVSRKSAPAKAPTPPVPSNEFPCPEKGCGRSFTLDRGLSRHLNETHGIIRRPERAPPKPKLGRANAHRIPAVVQPEDPPEDVVAERVAEAPAPSEFDAVAARGKKKPGGKAVDPPAPPLEGDNPGLVMRLMGEHFKMVTMSANARGLGITEMQVNHYLDKFYELTDLDIMSDRAKAKALWENELGPEGRSRLATRIWRETPRGS